MGGTEAGGARSLFREVAAGESRLWATKRVQYANLNRLHLRSIESILDPTVAADSIIGAVAYAVTSHGLRVTQREQGRIVAQRVEAPYLANASSGSWRSSSGQEREEWRVVVACLGVSKDGAGGSGDGSGGGKVVERVLSVNFLTDPVLKPTDLAGKGAAAVASLLGSVRSMSVSGGGSSANKAERAAAASGSSLSAVEIANARSNQRAESLIQAIVAELGKIGCGNGAAAGGAGAGDFVFPAAGGPLRGSLSAEQEKGAFDGVEAEASAYAPRWDGVTLVLAPFDSSGGGGGGSNTGVSSAAAAAVSSPRCPEEDGAEGCVTEEQQQRPSGQGGGQKGGDTMNEAREADASPSVVEVRLCLQFVEGLCARAEEYSRQDAAETWKPLWETITRLENDNAVLRQLLEPKYRAAGVEPPPVPTWSDRTRVEKRDGSWMGPVAAHAADGNGPDRRVLALLRFSPLFAIEGKSVRARVKVAPDGAVAPETAAGEPRDQDGDESSAAAPTAPAPACKARGRPGLTGADSVHSASSSAVATDGRRGGGGIGRCQSAAVVRAAVTTLAEVIGRACEAQEEAFLKDRLPGAQDYTARLEGYREAIVGGAVIKPIASSLLEGGGRGRDDGGNGGGGEADDEMWRLFAARDTRLYSSPAALGKKPGRIYVTHDTLWFHSKVLGFESRHIQPLAEVESITLLGTALDLSSSLVLATKGADGAPEELMLVFPGQKLRQVRPLEILLRALVALAVKERAATAEETPSAANAAVMPGAHGDVDPARTT